MSLGFVFKNPDAFKWKCGRCTHWNDITDGLCKICKAPAATFVDAFRLRNVLTSEEMNFYKGTAPSLLREMIKFRQENKGLLTRILKQLEGEKDE